MGQYRYNYSLERSREFHFLSFCTELPSHLKSFFKHIHCHKLFLLSRHQIGGVLFVFCSPWIFLKSKLLFSDTRSLIFYFHFLLIVLIEGIEPMSPASQADSLPLSHWGSPGSLVNNNKKPKCGLLLLAKMMWQKFNLTQKQWKK